MLGVVLAGLILAAAADPAAAPTAPAPAAVAKAPAAKPPAGDPNALVCHSEQRPGSRLSTRVCMTAAEDARRGQRDRQELNAAQAGYARPGGDMMMMGPR